MSTEMTTQRNSGPIPEAIQFITDYQRGRYGYAVRDECKAFMYERALHAKTEKQLFQLQHSMEKYVIYSNRVIDRFDDQYCWVSQRGDIYYTQFGMHRRVAEDIFWVSEGEFEKTHAKVTYTTKSIEEAIEFMTQKPSNSMIRTLEEIFEIIN